MEIFGLECFLRERVSSVGVEARGDTDQIGFRFCQSIECTLEHFPIFGARSFRSDRKVKTVFANIARASAGIAGMLMNGDERGVRVIYQDVFGAVSVMNIEI